MTYKIKPYQESFLDDHVKIGTEVLKNWDNIGQSPKESLLQQYSQPDFDPNTKLYAFFGDKMVGFVTSKILRNENNSSDQVVALSEFRFQELTQI